MKKRMSDDEANSPEDVVDPRALRILSSWVEAHHGPGGWGRPRVPLGAEDAAYAKTAGYLFDPQDYTHDGELERARSLVSRVKVTDLADAFVASLSRRLLHQRPALGSFFKARSFSPHPFEDRLQNSICGQCNQLREARIDPSIPNHARYKWGAMPSLLGDDCLMLERFLVEQRVAASDADRVILRTLLSTAASSPKDARAADLAKAWAPVFRSNQAERGALLEVLVTCEVLRPSDVSDQARRRIPLRANWSDEAALWRGGDGTNAERVQELFGAHL